MKNLAFIIILAAIAGLGVWWWINGNNAQVEVIKDKITSDKPLVTEADLREQLTVIKMRRQKLTEKIELMEKSRQKTLSYLRDNNIRSKEDTVGKPEALIELRNLKNVKDTVKKFKSHQEKSDRAIARIEGVLRKMEHDRLTETIGLTEEEQIDLRAIEMELDDRLGIDENDIFADDEIDDLLNEANKASGVDLELDDVLN